jgi:SEC-C motif-containing protein
VAITTCYCGSDLPIADCCQPILAGKKIAGTPEALMRSRYTAFCTLDFNYLEASVHAQYREQFDRATNEAWAREATFERLEILSTHAQGDDGEVTFKAHFVLDGKRHVHREHSTFRRENGVWYFCKGE